MFIEELNFISLGKLFQMVTAGYKKLHWPVAVLKCSMSSLFALWVERPLIVPLSMNPSYIISNILKQKFCKPTTRVKNWLES